MRQRLFVFTYCVLWVTLVIWSCTRAAIDDRAGRLCLALLTPLVDLVEPVAALVARSARLLVVGFASAAAAFLVASSLRRARAASSDAGRAFLLAVASALVAQAALVANARSIGFGLYGVACVLVVWARWRGELAPDAPECKPLPFGWSEAGVLSTVTVLAAFFRFYALNRVINYFEGELSLYMVAATSVRGMIHANVADGGPWAPLGYFYYLPIFVTTRCFGTTVLAVRLASAAVSMLTVPLFYGLV